MADDRPFGTLPVVDVAPLRSASSGGAQAAGSAEVARQIEAACREHGEVRLEGKEYVVQDGDIINFRHAT